MRLCENQNRQVLFSLKPLFLNCEAKKIQAAGALCICYALCPHFPSVCCCVSAIRTILLSVISLLNEPNTFSPANVDASVMFRKWRDSKGKDKEYAEIIR